MVFIFLKKRIFVREYEYNVELLLERENRKAKIATQTGADEDALNTTCVESFKEVYATYAHLKVFFYLEKFSKQKKVLKVVVDAQMRYGSAEDYALWMIFVKKGKDKNVHNQLISAFADSSKQGIVLFINPTL